MKLRSTAFEKLAQNGVRRETVSELYGGARRTLCASLMLLGLTLTSTPILAHHSTAMYNMTSPVTVTGVVKRFEWTNPHAYIYMEVTDESGKTVEWTVEMMSLNHLKGYGWTHSTLKSGDMI